MGHEAAAKQGLQLLLVSQSHLAPCDHHRRSFFFLFHSKRRRKEEKGPNKKEEGGGLGPFVRCNGRRGQ